MKNPPNFEPDAEQIQIKYEICWVCKHRKRCPIDWECETLANLDNDDSNNGVDEA